MQMRWLPLRGQRKNKRDNRGSMLVMVIMIIAIVMTLVTVLYSMSLLNFKMKYTDKTSKDTFYDAESALDEIRAGLQNEVSGALSSSYILTMESYSQLTEEERVSCFKSEYIRCLREAVRETNDSSCYSLDNLSSYLVNTKYDDTTQTGAKIESTNNALKITEQGLILKDVEVSYYGKDDYVSYIRTDIVLNFPDMDFTQASSVPQLTTYSLVANQQFAAEGVTMNIEGNAYLGKDGTDGGAVINHSTMNLTNTADSVNKASVITGGDIQLTNAASFSTSDVELWARNIEVVSSTLNLSGSTYLQDDLRVGNIMTPTGAARGSDVTVSGDYYGYGSPSALLQAASATGYVRTGDSAAAEVTLADAIAASPADYSSAILVNGKDTTVDMSNLNTLILAGNSYIQATGQESTNLNIINSDTEMGESLSIKGSQTAYLIPASCVAPGSSNGGVNPMTASKYQSLIAEVGEDGLVDYDRIIADYGASLSSMGVNSCKTVYYRLTNGVNIVYLFMEFNTQSEANSFFEKYYSIAANKNSLTEKLALYSDSITLPDLNTMADNTQFYYNGNILVNDNNTAGFYINKLQSVTSDEQSYLTSLQSSYQDSFSALNKKLIQNYSLLTETEKGSDVYGNLVNGMTFAESKYNIAADGSKTFVSSGSGEKYAAIVVNGDYTITDSRRSVTGFDANGNTVTGAELCVVVASGDVTVKCDFEGLILAGGTITVQSRTDGSSNYTLTASPTKVAIALSAQNQDGVRASYYIKDAASIVSGLNSDSSVSTSGSGAVSISDLISYDNWQKN